MIGTSMPNSGIGITPMPFEFSRVKIIGGLMIGLFIFHLLFAPTLDHAQGGVEGLPFELKLIEQNRDLLGISDRQIKNLESISKNVIEKTATIARQAEIVLATLSDFSWDVGRNDSLLIRHLFQDYYGLLIKKKEAETEALKKMQSVLTPHQLAILGPEAQGDSASSQDK